MKTALLIGFFSLFLILGHSTLIYFKLREAVILKPAEIIFPWPNNGKFVSSICLFLSLASAAFLIETGNDFSWQDERCWKILISLTLTPLLIYSYYLINLFSTATKGNYKDKSQKTSIWKIGLIIPAAVTLYYFLYK